MNMSITVPRTDASSFMILKLGTLLQLLGDLLLDNSNAAVMVKYVSSLENMRVLMNLLRVNSLTYMLIQAQLS